MLTLTSARNNAHTMERVMDTRRIKTTSRAAALLVSEQLAAQGWVTEIVVGAAVWYVIATSLPY
jgi:hypothetical protein